MRRTASIAVASIAWTSALQAAQGGADSPRALEEVVVTAQKRFETLSSVPLSVTAVSGESLAASGAYSTSAIGDLSPNVHFASETGRDAVFITIRGVSGTDTRNEADPTTAFHIDGAYVPRLSGSNAYFYDVDRVEILRGPQGTLYGRNSTSGAVNVISRKPSGDFEGHVEALYGNYDRFLTTGAINIPLSGETLAMRAAFLSEDRDGYRRNDPARARGDDANDLSARVHLLAKPAEALSMLFTYETHSRKGVGGVQALLPFTGNPRPSLAVTDPERFALDTEGFRDNRTHSVRAQADYDLDAATLTYQFSMRREERDVLNDLDGTAVSDSTLAERFTSRARTHELRLTSNGDDAFDWIAGAFLLEERIDSVFNIQIPTAIGAFSRLDFDFRDRDLSNDSWAAFAQGSYALTDQLDLTLGARYTSDDKEKPDSAQVLRRENANGPPPLQTIVQNQQASWDKVTWRAALDYTLSDASLIYASVSTGYKAGGFNRGNSQAIYDPETVTSYEIGLKTRAFEDALRLGVSAFYYDYEGLQLAQVETQPNGVIENITRNAAAARVHGIEVEGEALPWRDARVSFALGYLDAAFGSFPNVLDDLNGRIGDISGNRLVNAPRWTGTIALEPYAFDVGPGVVTPRIQLHYEADAFLRIQNEAHDRRDAFTRTDARLRFEEAAGDWFGELYVENIENDHVVSSVSTGTLIIGVGPSFKGVFMAPRTYGLRVGARF